MLEEIMKKQKDVQISTIGKLQELSSYLMNSKLEPSEAIEENCLVDSYKNNLERSVMIDSLVSNIIEAIRGGK